MNIIKLDRRSFVKLASVAGAGLVLGVAVPLANGKKKDAGPAAEHPLGAFVVVDTDGLVTVYVSRSDMGQGVRTSLPMIVAEELDADWKRVRIRQADLGKQFGRQGTGGSGSIRTMWKPLRTAGATARAMLVGAAAAKWGVEAKEIAVAKGVVTHGAHKATYGELAEEAAKLAVPKDVALKEPAKFTIIGKKADRLDTPDLVVGRSQYGIDVKVPGMLYAVVARSPVFDGTVTKFDATKAKQVPGVREVIKIDSIGTDLPWAGVGVVADSTWAAMKGRDALEITWDGGRAQTETTDALRTRMDELITSGSAKKTHEAGDVDAALASAARRHEARYEVPYLAHACMEPMNATASVTSDGVEIWSPTQFPDWIGGAAAKATGVAPEKVKVHVTLLGGGFGRRANPDFGLEAVMLSKAVGKPVHVQWTREDDMQHDFYRPPSVHRMSGGLDANGNLTAWHHRMSSPSIDAYFGENDPTGSEIGGIDDLRHLIPAFRLEYAHAQSSVPRGWWRSVENSGNAFVVHSFLDELAREAGRDPIEFRLAMLPAGKVVVPAEERQKDYPFSADRLRKVIEVARDKSGWTSRPPAGRARGFAAWWSFLSYAAEVVEVSMEDGRPRVHRVVAAIDCGTPVNPDGIAAQVEGGIVYGLTAALDGEITIDGGKVAQSNFHDYPLLRISEMPVVEVHIIPSTAPPTGTGEPGLPPLAPAVANAVFALTGKRLRSLPLRA
ncbi:MAG TPA: xanthine dehydrogenase family protein molybdopterin-binding subunit [Thermoanaerobaculia bacterium]|nr:xanthine dehydrogenase family protein molybdopterin-binding subunit [Thermoanaerobaculia bacterium]